MDATFWAALAGIIWVDLLLSGDNAVVIALVCRQLPERQQKIGMALGAVAAIALRIILSFFVATLMAIPGLSIVGGLFLLYVAAKLLIDAGDGEPTTKPTTTLLGAITTIAIADVGMSLDNVMAIAALSHGNLLLMAFGVLLSIPLVIGGSVLIASIIGRFPILTWAGAALLGWVAGGIIAADPFMPRQISLEQPAVQYGLAVIGLAVVLAVGAVVRLMAAQAAPSTSTAAQP